MSTLHEARVYETLPERHGVLVVFRDGSYTPDGDQTFVRVLAARAHNHHGSSISLPQPGENGIVAELYGGMMVWMGSVHIQDANQIDPDPGLTMDRDDSGLMRRSRGNGDTEILHPSGLRLTMAQETGGLPPPLRTGMGMQKPSPIPYLELDHPSGLNIQIAPDGSIAITLPSGSGIDLGADGSVSVQAAGEANITALGTTRVTGTEVEVIGTDSAKVISMGDCSVSASGDMKVEGLGKVDIHGFDAVNLMSEGPVSVTSALKATITAPMVAILGVGTLNGKPIMTTG